MIRSLMQIALKGRAVIIGLAIALLLSGIYAFSQIDIEAYPDPVQPMIELLTLPNGLSAEEVERLVTVPLEYTLSTTRNLEAMRSISLFGLSDIRCYFSWDSDYYWDNAETINQLQFVSPSARSIATPSRAPSTIFTTRRRLTTGLSRASSAPCRA
jgi:cobalt-zinc-cadmium resistance protein CzcA